MDREQFLNRKPATADVTLPDGTALKVRKLTAAEVETIRRSYATDDKALAGFRFIVAKCVLRDDGAAMFGEGDADRLAAVDFETVQTIAEEVMRFSGLKVAPKNS
jgi:hypothetical protein